MMSEVFAGADTEGNHVELVVLDITDQNGASVMECYNKETGQAIFSARGVYTFLLSATDRHQKRSTGMISLLVDER